MTLDSPEIADMGETSDITGPLHGSLSGKNLCTTHHYN